VAHDPEPSNVKRETKTSRFSILRRRVFTVLSVLSLLLCLATIALWMRSYRRGQSMRFWHYSESGLVSWSENIASAKGIVLVWHGVTVDTTPVPQADRRARIRIGSVGMPRDWHPLDGFDRHFWGFAYHRSVDSFPTWTFTCRIIAFPHAVLVVLFALLPGWSTVGYVRSRRRHRMGLCPRCGYDLRATPDRCPECGAAAAGGNPKSETRNPKQIRNPKYE
jgi:hypothetical protein